MKKLLLSLIFTFNFLSSNDNVFDFITIGMAPFDHSDYTQNNSYETDSVGSYISIGQFVNDTKVSLELEYMSISKAGDTQHTNEFNIDGNTYGLYLGYFLPENIGLYLAPKIGLIYRDFDTTLKTNTTIENKSYKDFAFAYGLDGSIVFDYLDLVFNMTRYDDEFNYVSLGFRFYF